MIIVDVSHSAQLHRAVQSGFITLVQTLVNKGIVCTQCAVHAGTASEAGTNANIQNNAGNNPASLPLTVGI